MSLARKLGNHLARSLLFPSGQSLRCPKNIIGKVTTTTPKENLAARNKWIRAINALVSNLDLAETDDATLALVLGPLREAERRAERRGTSAAEPADAPTNEAPAVAAPANPPRTP